MPSPDARRPAPHPAAARARLLATLALAGTAAVTTACSGEDPFAIRASLETTLDTMAVFPFSGPQPLLPSAIDLFGRSVVRPALRGGVVPNFDLVVDTDAQGRVLLYPASLVASPPKKLPMVPLSWPVGRKKRRLGRSVATTLPPSSTRRTAPKVNFSLSEATVGRT